MEEEQTVREIKRRSPEKMQDADDSKLQSAVAYDGQGAPVGVQALVLKEHGFELGVTVQHENTHKPSVITKINVDNGNVTVKELCLTDPDGKCSQYVVPFLEFTSTHKKAKSEVAWAPEGAEVLSASANCNNAT